MILNTWQNIIQYTFKMWFICIIFISEAAEFGKRVAVLDYVNPSTQGSNIPAVYIWYKESQIS